MKYLIQGTGIAAAKTRARGKHELDFTSPGDEAQAFKDSTGWLDWNPTLTRCSHRAFHSWIARSGHVAAEAALDGRLVLLTANSWFGLASTVYRPTTVPRASFTAHLWPANELKRNGAPGGSSP